MRMGLAGRPCAKSGYAHGVGEVAMRKIPVCAWGWRGGHARNKRDIRRHSGSGKVTGGAVWHETVMSWARQPLGHHRQR